MMQKQNQQLCTLLEPVITGMGYQMLGIEYQQQDTSQVLCVYIDSANGISLDDCARVSHQVEGVLDVAESMIGSYQLQISSPGLDRPLFTIEQFTAHIGEWVRITLHEKMAGKRKYEGQISQVSEHEIQITSGDTAYSIPAELLKKANIVPKESEMEDR